MRTKIVPFKIKHAEEVFPLMVSDTTRPEIEGFKMIERSNLAITLLVDEKALAFGGIQPMYPGVAEVWSFITPEAKKYPLALHKAVTQFIRLHHKALNVHRIQTNVEFGQEAHLRWVERLGFQCEGLMYKFGPNKEDYFRYSLT